MRLRNRSSLLAIALGIVAITFLAPWLVGLGSTWLWMQEVGFQAVFLREVGTRLALVIGVGLAAYAFLRANLRLAQVRHRPLAAAAGDIAILTGLRARALERRLAVLALAAALLLGLAASNGWLTALRLLHGVPFGVTDPLFGRDVAYYAFTLPAIEGGFDLLTALIVLGAVVVVAFAVASGDVGMTGGLEMRGEIPVATPPQLRVARSAASHLAALAALFLVVSALRTWLVELPGLLHSTTGPLVGASCADVHATRLGLHVAAVAALLAAGAIALGIRRGRAGTCSPRSAGTPPSRSSPASRTRRWSRSSWSPPPSSRASSPTSRATSRPRAARGGWTA
jgi:uncharacterized protein